MSDPPVFVQVLCENQDVIEVNESTTTPSEIISVNMSFIIVWKVARLLVSPKNITSGSNIPQFVLKVAFH
jgi:hypothetical protein